MKPYAMRDDRRDNIGCCPGHDWPPTRKYSGTYSSYTSLKRKKELCKIAKRNRRRVDKQRLRKEINAY